MDDCSPSCVFRDIVLVHDYPWHDGNSLAVALARPAVLVDELTVGLDPEHRLNHLEALAQGTS
ncbi:MAG: hypothetical protein ACLSGS_12710 [Adlercreutzia sp.]